MIVYKKANNTKQSYKKVPAISIPIYIKWTKSSLIFNYLFHTPILTVKDAERITGLKNPNDLSLVNKMINLGILKEVTGKKRNKVFRYQSYVNLFE